MISLKLKYNEIQMSGSDSTSIEKIKKPINFFESTLEQKILQNICFVLEDNKQIFLNHSYLVAGEFTPDENTITLRFTTHIVILKGIKLNLLFESLMASCVNKVKIVNDRYQFITDNNEPMVSEIIVKQIE